MHAIGHRNSTVVPAALAAICLVLLSLPAMNAETPANGFDAKVAAAFTLTGDRTRGEEQFNRSCAECHGKGGGGDAAQRIPGLAGQRYRYLVRQLASIASGQRHGGAMHNVLSTTALRDAQTWVNLAAYLDAAPPPMHPKTGSGEFVKLGEAMFRFQCASCHESDARGDDEGFVPSLRNQHYPYLLGQLERLKSYHPAVDENLAQLMRSLKYDEQEGVADYLSRLHGLIEVPQDSEPIE